MNEWMNERTNEWVKEWCHYDYNEWTDKQQNERSNERPKVDNELVEEGHMDWVLCDYLAPRSCGGIFLRCLKWTLKSLFQKKVTNARWKSISSKKGNRCCFQWLDATCIIRPRNRYSCIVISWVFCRIKKNSTFLFVINNILI